MRYLSKGGFTLLEIIIVLLIAGIGLSIASVAISRSLEKNVVRRETARVQRTLARARELSLLQRTPHVFALDEEKGTFWIEKNGEITGRIWSVSDRLIIAGKPIKFMTKGNSRGGIITITDMHERGYLIEVDTVTGRAAVGRL
jgi:prepilin-type N-terminal cleavage/methylation domain-containing protein